MLRQSGRGAGLLGRGDTEPVLDALFVCRVNPGDWRAALKSAVESASFYGGARLGCRTMLDALIPAAEAASEGLGIKEVADAAEAGAERTAGMKPLAGRCVA